MTKTKKKTVAKKAATKKRRTAKASSAKQLAARAKFAAAAKARSKAAKAKKAPAKKRATKRRNSTTIIRAKRIDHLDVSKVHNGKVVRRKVRNGYLSLEIKGQAQKTPDGWKLGGKTYAQGQGIVPVTKKGFYLDRATGTVFAKRSVKKNPKKARKSSPTAVANRKEFAGKYSGDLTLHFPQKSLSGLSTLGPLVSLQGEFGTIKPTKGGVYYCQDAKGRIHIGAKSDDDLWTRVKENLGAVKRVEYRAAKPHLGYPQVVTWFHDFEAPYPILKSDGEGGLRQVGGGYKIKREGIVG